MWGVVLRTGEGDEYVLRRVGGNAFRDPATITGIGLVSGRNFIMKDWTVKKDD